MLEPSEINCSYVSSAHSCCILHLDAYFLEILALELLDEGAETLIIGLDTDGLKNSLDVLDGWRGVATDGEEEVCCEVLHFDSWVKKISMEFIFVQFARR